MSSHSHSHPGSLIGASIIITRPTATALPLEKAALNLGARVVRLPGLRLCAMEDAKSVAESLIEARSADAWVFTSPAAARFAASFDGAYAQPLSMQVFAVGAGTARELARHGIQAIAPRSGHDSAGLLELPQLQSPQGQRIAIIDAPGGRDVIAPNLTGRGASVTRIAVYRRVAPRLTRRHFENLEHAAMPWISLVSSGEALANLNQALPSELLMRWRKQAIVLSSARLAGEAEQLGFSDRHIARSALTEDLLEVAGDVLGRHRL